MDDATKKQRERLNVSILVFGCWLMMFAIAVLPNDDDAIVTKARAAVFVVDVLLLIVLVLRRSELGVLLRNTRVVLASPRTASMTTVNDSIFVLIVVCAAVSVFFMTDIDAVGVFAIRTGIVVFLVGLKIAKDRWIPRKR